MRIWIRTLLACGIAGLSLAHTHACAETAPTPVPVEAFARFSPFSSPQLSPDGKYLAVTADQGGGNHALLVYRVADMQRTAFLRFPKYEMPVRVAWVSNERLVIAKGRKLGSLEKPVPSGEVIASDFDGGNQKYIYGYEQRTSAPGLERGFGYIDGLPEQADGHFYLRQLSWKARTSAIYDVDTRRPTYHLVTSINVPDMAFVVDRDGVARFAYGTDDDDNYLLYESANGKAWTPVPATRAGGKWAPVAFSADNQQVYAWLNRDEGPAQLVRSRADGSDMQVLAGDAFASAGDTQWTHTPSVPFAASAGTGMPRFQYFDTGLPDAQLHMALSQSLPGRRVDFINESSDGSVVLTYIDSDRDPGTWYLFDRGSNKLSKLLTGREGIDPALMGERRSLRFAASDGMELEAVLTIPHGIADPRNLPTILLPHGGPHYVSDDWAFDTDAQFLASRGYLVLQVNYRGSGGRGKAFERAGYLNWGTRIQEDLLDGLRWTIAQGMTDPQRICAYGASFGAYSAMMTAARAPDLIKCAAGLGGVYDLKMMYSKGDIKDDNAGRKYLQRVIGRNDAELSANSPTALAGRIVAPVFLAHGEKDERAPIAQANAMRAALTAAGRAPQWMAVPNEGHGFYNEDNSIAFYKALEDFMAHNIGGDSHD